MPSARASSPSHALSTLTRSRPAHALPGQARRAIGATASATCLEVSEDCQPSTGARLGAAAKAEGTAARTIATITARARNLADINTTIDANHGSLESRFEIE